MFLFLFLFTHVYQSDPVSIKLTQMKKGKCKAFSSSSTLLWNFSLFLSSLFLSFFPSVRPSFLPYSFTLPPKKRLKYLKKFTGLCTKMLMFFVCVGLLSYLIFKKERKKSLVIYLRKEKNAKKKPEKTTPKGRFLKKENEQKQTWISHFYALWLVALLEIKQSDRQND